MIITKALKYKIIEYCIDNFFNTLSRNCGIYYDNKAFHIIITRTDDVRKFAILIKIFSKELDDIETSLSFETIKTFNSIFGEETCIKEAVNLILAPYMPKLLTLLDREIFNAIVMELIQKINAEVFINKK